MYVFAAIVFATKTFATAGNNSIREIQHHVPYIMSYFLFFSSSSSPHAILDYS